MKVGLKRPRGSMRIYICVGVALVYRYGLKLFCAFIGGGGSCSSKPLGTTIVAQKTPKLQLRTIYPHPFLILIFPQLNDSFCNRPPKGRRKRDRDSVSDLSELLFRRGSISLRPNEQEGCNTTLVAANDEWSKTSPNT